MIDFSLELKTPFDWEKLNHYQHFDCSLKAVNDTTARVDASKVSNQEFIDKYELPGLPCVIINDQRGWQAQKKWTSEVRDKFYVGENVAQSCPSTM